MNSKLQSSITRKWLLPFAAGATLSAILMSSYFITSKNDISRRVQIKHLNKIRLMGAPACELILPTLIAMSNGYFESQGLSIKELILASGTDTRTALISGDIDVALLAFVHVPLARTKNQELKIVAGIYEREIFSVVVRSNLEDEVKTISDLRGRRIGVAKVGSGNWAAISSYLSKAGMDPKSDVEFVPVGNNLQTVYNALKTNQIDAYPSFEPQTTKLIREGIVFALLSIWKEEIHKRWIGESAMSMVVGVREQTILKNPELIQKVVNAQRLGLIYIRTHLPEEIADVILRDANIAAHLGGIDRLTLIAVLDKIKNNFGTSALDRKGYDNQMKMYVATGVLEYPVPFEEATDWIFAGLSP